MILECFLAGRYFGPGLVWDSRHLSLWTCLIAALDIAFNFMWTLAGARNWLKRSFRAWNFRIEVNNNLRQTIINLTYHNSVSLALQTEGTYVQHWKRSPTHMKARPRLPWKCWNSLVSDSELRSLLLFWFSWLMKPTTFLGFRPEAVAINHKLEETAKHLHLDLEVQSQENCMVSPEQRHAQSHLCCGHATL